MKQELSDIVTDIGNKFFCDAAVAIDERRIEDAEKAIFGIYKLQLNYKDKISKEAEDNIYRLYTCATSIFAVYKGAGK